MRVMSKLDFRGSSGGCCGVFWHLPKSLFLRTTTICGESFEVFLGLTSMESFRRLNMTGIGNSIFIGKEGFVENGFQE
jgi:hypothetical protein